MVKVQKQHQAGPTSSHLPRSPFSVPYDCCWEGKHLSTVAEMGFHSAAIAVPSSPLYFSPSLPWFFVSPPFLWCHIWKPAPHLFMWSGLLPFFQSYLNVLYLVLLAVSLHLRRSTITSRHNWSLCNYMAYHRIPPPSSEQHHCSYGRPK